MRVERAEFAAEIAFMSVADSNPTGVTMTPVRAEELARLLAGTRTVVVEDDSAGVVSSSEAVSLGRWIPGHTVHIRSFSKSHGPDLRLAAVSAPPELLRAVNGRRQLGQGWSSRLLQRILLNLLTDPAATAAVAGASREYARRRALVVDELARLGVRVGGAEGINIWVPVHDESAAIMRLAAGGIGVTPGAPFTLLPGDGGHIRVTAGLIRDHHAELAAQIAAAARTTAWGPRARSPRFATGA